MLKIRFSFFFNATNKGKQDMTKIEVESSTKTMQRKYFRKNKSLDLVTVIFFIYKQFRMGSSVCLIYSFIVFFPTSNLAE